MFDLCYFRVQGFIFLTVVNTVLDASSAHPIYPSLFFSRQRESVMVTFEFVVIVVKMKTAPSPA